MSQTREFDQSAGREFVQSITRERNRLAATREILNVSGNAAFVGFTDPPLFCDFECIQPIPCGDNGCRVPLPTERWLQSVTVAYQAILDASGQPCPFVTSGGTVPQEVTIKTTIRYSLEFADLEFMEVLTSCLGDGSAGSMGLLYRFEKDIFGNVTIFDWHAANPGNPQNELCDNAVFSGLGCEGWDDRTDGSDPHFHSHREEGSQCQDASPGTFVEDIDVQYSMLVTRADCEALAAARASAVTKDSVVTLTTIDAQGRCQPDRQVWFGFDANPSDPLMERVSGLLITGARGFCGGRAIVAVGAGNSVAAGFWNRGEKAASPDGSGRPSEFLEPLPSKPNVAMRTRGWSRGQFAHWFRQPWDCICDIGGTPVDAGPVEGEQIYPAPDCGNEYLT